jgi:hypothetical protein
MSTSQTSGLSEPTGSAKISSGVLGYIRSRYRQRQYDLVIREFKKSGISQADLARRLDKSPEVISRLLARPGNWESDTFSDLLFAISGAVASLRADHPLAVPSSAVTNVSILSATGRDSSVTPTVVANTRTATDFRVPMAA